MFTISIGWLLVLLFWAFLLGLILPLLLVVSLVIKAKIDQ